MASTSRFFQQGLFAKVKTIAPKSFHLLLQTGTALWMNESLKAYSHHQQDHTNSAKTNTAVPTNLSTSDAIRIKR